MSLSYSLAGILASLAETEAHSLGVPLCIALADANGDHVIFARMDGALPASAEIAKSKAFTAAALRMSTEELGILAQPGQPLFGIQDAHPGKIVLFGGGLPLRFGGKVIGAIGISGGTVDEDVLVAKHVAAALDEMAELSGSMAALVASVWLPRGWTNGLETRLATALADMGTVATPRMCSILAGALILSARERI